MMPQRRLFSSLYLSSPLNQTSSRRIRRPGTHRCPLRGLLGALLAVVSGLSAPTLRAETVLQEDFSSYADAAQPADWFDTGENNSMIENDSLFQVWTGLANNRFFGTKSTLANIHSHLIVAGSDQWSNYEFSGRMWMTSTAGGMGVTFLSDYPISDAYYRLAFVGTLPWRISAHGTKITDGQVETFVYPVAYTWYNFRVLVSDTGEATRIQARVWKEGVTEPTTWQADCYDSSKKRRTMGTVGVWTYKTGSKYYDDLEVSGPAVQPPDNEAPQVSAGEDQTIVWPTNKIQLTGTVTDDGYPKPPAQTTVTWSMVSGPGTVTFDNVDTTTPTAAFSTAGDYVLELLATDGELTATDQVAITVTPPPNQAPTVSNGADQTIAWPNNTITLQATVTDDGWPNPPAQCTVEWSLASGPGTVTFSDPAATSTTATFSAPGTYSLLTTANDGELTGSDTLTITITGSIVVLPLGTLMQEDFDAYAVGTNPQGWTDTDANNSTTVNDTLFTVCNLSGQTCLGTTSTATNIHSHYTLNEAATWSNYEFTGRMLTTSLAGGTGVTFLSNYPNSDAYYRLAFVGALPWRLSSHGTSITSGTIDSPVYPVANTWYRFRVKVADTGTQTQIQARVWVDGNTEPTEWQMDCIDSSATRRTVGTAGVWCYSTGSKYWDDLTVVDASSVAATVTIQAEPATGEAPLDVQFQAVPRDANATLPDATFSWDFGDNSTPMNGNNVTHTFVTAGSYLVTLSMTLAGAVSQVSCDQFAIQVTQATLNQGVLSVSPAEGLTSSGDVGGSFTPSSKNYTLTNTGGATLDWTVGANASWIGVSPSSGQLAPNATATVNVAINSTATKLAAGIQEGTVSFTNATCNAGNTSRTVSLTVGSGDGTPAGTMNAASRTTGVAPLLVFFDAVDTVSGVTQPSDGDYAALHYQWNFGDADAGNWSTTGQSRNTVTGYCAAHVFNNPGTYTVRLTVTTPEGDSNTFQQTINVTAFSGATYYVSNSGSDGNDGLSESRPLQSFATAMSKVASNTRILFKRGESWTTGSGTTIRAMGPGIIGAYGTGNQPVITMTGSNPLFCIDNADDWRIMDLHLIGPLTTSEYSAVEGRSLRKNLVLRTWVTGFRSCIGHSWIGPDQHTENGIVDCFIEQAQINNLYLGGKKLAVLGNQIERCQTSHLLRIFHIEKGVINNNILWYPGGDRLSLKLHNEYALGLPESCYMVISENDCRGQTVVTAIGPQQEIPIIDERLRDVVFEKNIIRATSLTQGMSQFACRRATIRNNIFDCSGSSKYMQFVVRIWKASGEPAPEHMRVYNNSAYKSDNGSEFVFGLFTAGTDIIASNNLAVAPAFTGYEWTMLNNNVGATASNNLLTKVQQYTNPTGDDFSLLSDSAGRDAGAAISEVYEDYVGAFRPQGGGYDIGAMEQ